MKSPTERIADAARVMRDAVGELIESRSVQLLSDADLVASAVSAGLALRTAEAALIELGAEVEARSQSGVREERLAIRYGARNTNELLQRATGVYPATAAKILRAGAAIRGATNVMTGETLPPALPELRGALGAGATGLDGTLAISGPLLEAQRAADPCDFAVADREICATAIRGVGDDLPMTADELRVMATVWATAMDQDGAEPLEQAAMRKRAVSIGAVRDGLVAISGRLLPEVAAQLQWIADATGNPRVNGVRFVEADECLDDEALVERDPRTATQKLHDALATALTVAAASENLPTIGGAAPTLVVHVDESELLDGRGWARLGATPVALSVARHVGCSGVIQRVSTVGADGRITAIGTEERVFNRHQRRAIALRDGGCVMPGCTVAAAWCEVHHVTEHAHGGKTHTDNGVLLCWNHHRFLEHSGWAIRMNTGTPEVKAPHWMDPHGRWRKPHPPRPMTRANRRT